ncbi:hypothetical protein [Streptomyces sp. NPDC002671]
MGTCAGGLTGRYARGERTGRTGPALQHGTQPVDGPAAGVQGDAATVTAFLLQAVFTAGVGQIRVVEAAQGPAYGTFGECFECLARHAPASAQLLYLRDGDVLVLCQLFVRDGHGTFWKR